MLRPMAAMNYVETSDLRAGETLAEWRRRHPLSSSKHAALKRRALVAVILAARKAHA